MKAPRPKGLPKKIPAWAWRWLAWRTGKKPAPKPPTPTPPPPTPTSLLGVDYAWAHPAPAAIKAAGYHFALRYLSDDSTKNLSLTEAKELHAAGLAVGVVWESTSNRALAGFAAGKRDAQAALAELRAVAAPPSMVVYFALDFDLKDYAPLLPQLPAFSKRKLGPVAGYFEGVASVIPVSRIGAYGGYWAIKRLLDAKLVSFGWQTYAWSGSPTKWDPRAHVRQIGSITVGGVKCDLNKALAENYGQWKQV